ncbi:hypothetical protein SAMN05444336_11327 [Albimonas donghaensis]|uniref:LPS sulfotransferase NodH n=1 Tax=Albimonas donghaensis TaxID=356660 RepID=A0A1H3FQJ4_9RHOB|nr:hypothetical protein [Albimonas donghaensis]SDX92409.1 hypothetical protein SAMN05444336_11327 [Albimonas donghaensis]
MTSLRTKISSWLPQGLRPYGRRLARRGDQLLHARSARRRPGVAVMLHVGRCGSTVLANMLDQNPAIHWDGKLPRKAGSLYGDAVKRLDFGRWMKRQFATSGDRYYGFEFKILADQYPAILGATTQEFLEQCKAAGVTHYILLTRRNTLRHVISHYASIARGAWHMSARDRAGQEHLHLDTEKITTGSAPGRPLISYLREVDEAHRQVRALLRDQNLLEVEYEADIDAQGPATAYEKICRFLGIAPERANVRNSKANPFPMSSTVTNFDEIEACLSGTEFEWMLERDAADPAAPDAS